MVGVVSILVATLVAAAVATSSPPGTSSAWPLPKLGWSSANGTLPNGYAPAYLASGLFGVRVPRYALGGSVCKDGDPKQCQGDRTVQCLVGGYEHQQVHGCTVGCDHPDQNLGGAPAPYPFQTEVNVSAPGGQQWFSLQQAITGQPNTTKLKTTSQSLDFATGEMSTVLEFEAADGSWSLELEVMQLISQAIPSVALQTLTLSRRVPADLNISFYPMLTTENLAVETTKPTLNCPRVGVRDKGCPNGGGAGAAILMEMTSNSGSKMAAAVYTQCVNSVNPKPIKCPGALPCGPVAPCQSGPVGAMTMQSHVAVVGDASHPRPFKGALGMMWRSGYLGFDVHRQQNRDVWSDRWKSRVVATGPAVTATVQAGLDASLFNLLSTAHKSSRSSMSIDGYSCTEYGGHIFWDVDFWMVPPLALLDAPAAAAVQSFRGRTLEESQKTASLYGVDGAQFPWETSMSDGSDATTGASLWSEQHITIDVALGVWSTARSINSTAFTRDTAFPVLSNAADWICSRGTWTERGFEVLYMGGPDEDTPQVNNSGYFNVGSMIVLRSAVALGKQLGPSMGGHVDAKSLLKWEKTLEMFFLPKTPDGVIKSFDASPDDTSKATLDNWSLGSLQYFLAQGFALPLDAETINKTLYAEELIRHRVPPSNAVGCGYTLHPDAPHDEWMICPSYAVVGALMGSSVHFRNFSDGRAEAAANMAVFGDKYFLPPFMITTESGSQFRHWGNYMTNFGSTLGAVMYGFTGVQPADDLTGKISPTSYGVRAAALPAGWDEISYVAYFGGARYAVTARHGQHANITLMDENEFMSLNIV